MNREKVNQTISKLNNVNCNVKPTTKVDNGANGKKVEILIKLAYNKRIATRQAVTSNTQYYDMKHKGEIYEIKTACGDIGTLIQKQNKIDYILYSPQHANHNEIYKLNTGDFLQVLEECGLIRDKKRTNGTQTKAIQTFYYNSTNTLTKRGEMFIDLLSQYALDTFTL